MILTNIKAEMNIKKIQLEYCSYEIPVWKFTYVGTKKELIDSIYTSISGHNIECSYSLNLDNKLLFQLRDIYIHLSQFNDNKIEIPISSFEIKHIDDKQIINCTDKPSHFLNVIFNDIFGYDKKYSPCKGIILFLNIAEEIDMQFIQQMLTTEDEIKMYEALHNSYNALIKLNQ